VKICGWNFVHDYVDDNVGGNVGDDANNDVGHDGGNDVRYNVNLDVGYVIHNIGSPSNNEFHNEWPWVYLGINNELFSFFI
jgi:hypothetical protein